MKSKSNLKSNWTKKELREIKAIQTTLTNLKSTTCYRKEEPQKKTWYQWSEEEEQQQNKSVDKFRSKHLIRRHLKEYRGEKETKEPLLKEGEGGVGIEAGLFEIGLDVLHEWCSRDTPPLRDRGGRSRRRSRGSSRHLRGGKDPRKTSAPVVVVVVESGFRTSSSLLSQLRVLRTFFLFIYLVIDVTWNISGDSVQ